MCVPRFFFFFSVNELSFLRFFFASISFYFFPTSQRARFDAGAPPLRSSSSPFPPPLLSALFVALRSRDTRGAHRGGAAEIDANEL
jgi:hypothetical protein